MTSTGIGFARFTVTLFSVPLITPFGKISFTNPNEFR
jgi:hypothetical protein